MNKLEALLSVPMFEGISPDVLEPMVSHFISREYERGDELWKEGQQAHNFTFIIQGQVKVVKYRNDGRETILGVFDEGDAVGQIAVYQKMRYPASAVALNDTYLLEIYRDHFFGMLSEHRKLLEAVLNGMMLRNRDLVRRVHELTTGSAEQRLAMLFMKFSVKLGVRRKVDDSIQIHIPIALSRSDLAELINVRVETAIRIMSRWNKEGPVETVEDGFLVVDSEKLEEPSNQLK